MSRSKPTKRTRKRDTSKGKNPSKRAKDRALIQIRSVLGASVLTAARNIYGQQKIDDAALVIARRLSEKKKRELRKTRKGNPHDALTETDRTRHKVLKELHYQRPEDVRFFRRRDGKYNKIVKGKKVGTVTAKQVDRYESGRPYRKLVRLVGGTLDLSPASSRRLIRDVAAQSRRKLREFKRSTKYKRMSKRKKRSLSAERTTVAALIRLEYLLTMKSDPAGIRFVR